MACALFCTRRFLFFGLKIEVQADICGDHGEIQDVHGQNVPDHIAAEDLAQDAAEVAGVNQQQKGQALTLGGAIFQGGADVVGPGAAKADHHGDFQKLSDMFHKLPPEGNNWFCFLYYSPEKKKCKQSVQKM